jgi:hypothetical protein
MSAYCTPIYEWNGVSCLLCGATSAAAVEDRCLFDEEEVEPDGEEEESD